jgi:hypothetical protein
VVVAPPVRDTEGETLAVTLAVEVREKLGEGEGEPLPRGLRDTLGEPKPLIVPPGERVTLAQGVEDPLIEVLAQGELLALGEGDTVTEPRIEVDTLGEAVTERLPATERDTEGLRVEFPVALTLGVAEREAGGERDTEDETVPQCEGALLVGDTEALSDGDADGQVEAERLT